MTDNTTQTPVVEIPSAETPAEAATAPAEAAKPKASPAQDLRDIQQLIVNGIYPGNVSPSVVKAYNLLEQMALVVEREASKEIK